jgi:hypothetical protein
MKPTDNGQQYSLKVPTLRATGTRAVPYVILTPEKDGMVAVIAENRKYECLSIEHRGHVLKGVDDTESDEVKKWTPAYENYSFTEVDGGTELTVDIDIPSSYEAYFEGVWPKALKAVKELAEKQEKL